MLNRKSNYKSPTLPYPLKSGAGFILIYEVVIMFIFSVAVLALLAQANGHLKTLKSSVNREQALQIAEAGINYYQWHLAHFPADYQDGTGAAGPYVHDYLDANTNSVLGTFTLELTPPLVGSTVVTIKSTGFTLQNPNTKRTITTRYGIPSLAKYTFLTNADVYIGAASSINGQLHANGGIRFEGTTNGPVTSAKSTYTCQPVHGCSPPQVKPGIWENPPNGNQSFWQFPVPNVDYSTITSDLAAIKSAAQTSGIYLPPSGAQGYSLVFNSNGTVTIRRVNSLRSHGVGYDVNGGAHNEDLDYNAVTPLNICTPSPCAIPANGIMFIEDRTWIEGVVNGRVTVTAARLPYNPPTAPSILIPNNITYLAKDGNHALGLISQKDVLLTYFVPNDLEINGALIAQNGSYQRYRFSGSLKNTLTFYGSNSSFGIAGTYWSSGSGYPIRYHNYDPNLLYGPPPNFPLSNSGYQQLSWTSS